jgi:hypothetical protein
MRCRNCRRRLRRKRVIRNRKNRRSLQQPRRLLKKMSLADKRGSRRRRGRNRSRSNSTRNIMPCLTSRRSSEPIKMLPDKTKSRRLWIAWEKSTKSLMLSKGSKINAFWPSKLRKTDKLKRPKSNRRIEQDSRTSRCLKLSINR